MAVECNLYRAGYGVHTYIGMNNTVAENIGKCVMRKAAYKDGDREVLQDTNNSTVDFTPAATPSLFNK